MVMKPMDVILIFSLRVQAMFLRFFIKHCFGKASQTPGHIAGDSKTEERGYQNKTNENQMPPVPDFVFFAGRAKSMYKDLLGNPDEL